VFYAGVLGFVGAVVLTLGFALPALISAPPDVARMAAAMFTISYSEGLAMSVMSGAAWDIGGRPRYAFMVMALAALPLILIPPFARFFRRADATAV
jgi:MFS transporter, CP family, cyanate transporter